MQPCFPPPSQQRTFRPNSPAPSSSRTNPSFSTTQLDLIPPWEISACEPADFSNGGSEGFGWLAGNDELDCGVDWPAAEATQLGQDNFFPLDVLQNDSYVQLPSLLTEPLATLHPTSQLPGSSHVSLSPPETMILSHTQSQSQTQTQRRSRSRSRTSSPPSIDPVTALKRQRNNIAARKYRQKKVDRISELEIELKSVKKERDDLRIQLARQEAETAALKTLLKLKAGS